MATEKYRHDLWPHSGLPVRELISQNTGNVILVDGDYDGEYFAQHSWREVNDYVMALTVPIRGEYLARLVLGLHGRRHDSHMPVQVVGYHNGNHLDCRSANLYVHSWAQSAAKRAVGTGVGSGFKGSGTAAYVGVQSYPIAQGARYYATGKNAWLHAHPLDTPEEAARIYDAWAVKEYGRFAVLNFPHEQPKL